MATVVKCQFLSKQKVPSGSKLLLQKQASEANGRITRAAQTYPHAHVEGDNSDTDVLRGFSVHI